MHAVMKKCCRKVAETGLFEEWARAVERNLDPSVLANYILEAMRSEDDLERRAFTVFVNFIHTRTWSEVFNELVAEVDQDQIKAFSAMAVPNGEEFFIKFRTLVISQVESYWREYAASQKKEDLEVISELEKTPLDKLEDKIRAIVAEQMAAALQAMNKEFAEKIIEQVKRHFEEGEGESWKRGGDPEKE